MIAVATGLRLQCVTVSRDEVTLDPIDHRRFRLSVREGVDTCSVVLDEDAAGSLLGYLSTADLGARIESGRRNTTSNEIQSVGPLLELHSTSSGNPPGVGGMAPDSSAMWIRARGQWYRVTTEKSAHKVVQAILRAVGAEEWGPAADE